VRFIPWSAPASPVQQDRLQKCRLTKVALPQALARDSKEANTIDNQQRGPKAQGKSFMRLVLTGSLLQLELSDSEAETFQ
jgi:hypothetical protein